MTAEARAADRANPRPRPRAWLRCRETPPAHVGRDGHAQLAVLGNDDQQFPAVGVCGASCARSDPLRWRFLLRWRFRAARRRATARSVAISAQESWPERPLLRCSCLAPWCRWGPRWSRDSETQGRQSADSATRRHALDIEGGSHRLSGRLTHRLRRPPFSEVTCWLSVMEPASSGLDEAKCHRASAGPARSSRSPRRPTTRHPRTGARRDGCWK